ncbi:hypothetical protein [Chitinophaga sp. Cy-1792]|uniref:hypothetical protein n=1 Tax=Chitinophaga sp. Cy-1792 TaxID=2608339 RepID=UPI0014233CFD|nr:hypothetical protein [Chitinophaga sp. Cy-1792]NIG56380.1 hypothetical protein [Chitinophaga sp. Cy-1792]
MKKLFLVPVLLLTWLLLPGNHVFAQNKPDYVKVMTDSMKSRLSLNDDQYSKVYDINKSFSEKMGGIRKDNSLSKPEKGEKMKALSAERDGELKKILTDDQYKKYEANKAERREMAKEKYKERQERKEEKQKAKTEQE